MDINTGIVVGLVIVALILAGLKLRGRGFVLEVTVDGDGYAIMFPLFLLLLLFLVVGLGIVTLIR